MPNRKKKGYIMNKNVMIYRLIPFTEAMKNQDGTYTTVDILAGMTNQIEASKIFFNGHEYLIYEKSIKPDETA